MTASRLNRTFDSSASSESVGAVELMGCDIKSPTRASVPDFAALLHELAPGQPLRTNVRNPSDGRLNET